MIQSDWLLLSESILARCSLPKEALTDQTACQNHKSAHESRQRPLVGTHIDRSRRGGLVTFQARRRRVLQDEWFERARA